MVLGLALVLLAGLGYFQRMRTEKAVVQGLRDASLQSLRSAHISVKVSYLGGVTLDGNVSNAGDSTAAESLARAVFGVTHVNNRLQVVPVQVPQKDDAESFESLISQGMAFLDAGDYANAIASFSKAAQRDTSNKRAQDLLSRAQRAAETEEKLLKSRQPAVSGK
jgi:hypothetical protein